MKNYTEHELINKINSELRECTICKNYNTRGGNFLSYSPKNIKDPTFVDIIFIAQNPGKSWLNTYKDPAEIIPFALHKDNNNYHKFFDFIIEKFANIYLREPVFYITNIVKCATPENKLDDNEMISNCISKYLVKELEYFKSNDPALVSLGKPSNNAFDTIPQLKNYDVYKMKHPGWMNRQGPKVIEQNAEDLVKYIQERNNKNNGEPKQKKLI